MALCSLSTGSTAHAALARRLHHQRAGHDEDFLVGERDRLAGLDRREHGVERRRAGRGEEHDVGVGMRGDGDQALGARPRRAAAARRAAAVRPAASVERGRASPSRSCRGRSARPARRSAPMFSPAASATTRSRSGCASTTASALCPIEPVEPRMAMRFIRVCRYRDEGVVDGAPRTASCRCGRARRRAPG